MIEIKKTKFAFSLTELIVSVSIMSVLSLLVVYSVAKKTEKRLETPISGRIICYKDKHNQLHQRTELHYRTGKASTITDEGVSECEFQIPQAQNVEMILVGAGGGGGKYEETISAKTSSDAELKYEIPRTNGNFILSGNYVGDYPGNCELPDNNGFILENCYSQNSSIVYKNLTLDSNNDFGKYVNQSIFEKMVKKLPFAPDVGNNFAWGDAKAEGDMNVCFYAIENKKLQILTKKCEDSLDIVLSAIALENIKYNYGTGGKAGKIARQNVKPNQTIKIKKDDIGSGGNPGLKGTSTKFGNLQAEGGEPGMIIEQEYIINDNEYNNFLPESPQLLFIAADSVENGNAIAKTDGELSDYINELESLANREPYRNKGVCDDSQCSIQEAHALSFGAGGSGYIPKIEYYPYLKYELTGMANPSSVISVNNPKLTNPPETDVRKGNGGAIIVQW
ncbi:MAG: hypothetical protein E7Z91_06515 [Cyanobacteria bacterium SIG30]|nr:hypothetical protein [Cyanobacteria bacterium SIG30]